MAPRPIDARAHLAALAGQTITTLSQRRSNQILRLDGAVVVVATEKSPAGEPVEIDDVQSALDRLVAGEDVEVSVASLGHRSAFVGAVLATVPGAVVLPSRPRRVRLPDSKAP